MRATFVLHNGAIVEADVKSIRRTSNPVTSETTGFEWTHGRRGAEADELFYIRVEQVDAVIVHQAYVDHDVPDEGE